MPAQLLPRHFIDCAEEISASWRHTHHETDFDRALTVIDTVDDFLERDTNDTRASAEAVATHIKSMRTAASEDLVIASAMMMVLESIDEPSSKPVSSHTPRRSEHGVDLVEGARFTWDYPTAPVGVVADSTTKDVVHYMLVCRDGSTLDVKNAMSMDKWLREARPVEPEPKLDRATRVDYADFKILWDYAMAHAEHGVRGDPDSIAPLVKARQALRNRDYQMKKAAKS